MDANQACEAEAALRRLMELVSTADETPLGDAKTRQLALQWPSLAAALADLLAAHLRHAPRPLRAAAHYVATEQRLLTTVNALAGENPRAVAGMGSCRTCGHVQAQHGERGCGQCTLCRGWEAK